jgi:AcrR family transcriptional regulator
MPGTSTRISEVILKAAGLIRDQGFEATTVNDICRVTGLTKGGLYHYITSKRELLYRIMQFALEMLEVEVMEPVAQIADPEEQLRALIRLHVQRIAREEGALLTILTDEDEGLEPRRREEIRARKRLYYDFVRDILARMQAEGKLANVNLNVATFDILAQILFVARWFDKTGPMTPVQIADQIADTSLGGLKHRAAVPVA